MCRLVGIVASEVTEFATLLNRAPRSLARLSREHPDGWGIAAHGSHGSIPPPSTSSPHEAGWRVHKGTKLAADCERYLETATRSAGTMLVAHVRKKTVGETSIDNTHPFVRNGWVFAHNGTLTDHASLLPLTSEERLSQIRGATDSEVLFSFLLSRLDAAGLTRLTCAQSRAEATRVLGLAAAELRERKAGAFNFLLSDGASLFAHRFGRTLYILERKDAVSIASEHLTDDAWTELPESTFLRVDRGPEVAWASEPVRAAS